MIDPERDRRWYEQRKRAVVCAALARPHYRRVFEPACGYGALTQALGERCDELIAMDADKPSIRAAKSTYRGSARAMFLCGRLPEDWPGGTFDLIVLSEWVYYVDRHAREDIAARVRESLAPDGEVVAIHWGHPIPETREDVPSIHEALGAAIDARPFIRVRDEDFVLDGWTRRAGSVAHAEGLV